MLLYCVQLLQVHGAEFVEVSAKDGAGVGEAFLNLAERVYQKQSSRIVEPKVRISSIISLNDTTDEEYTGEQIFVGKKRKKLKMFCFIFW